MSVSLLLMAVYCRGQDGNAGLEEADAKVRSYFDSGCNLMYAIGAVPGLVDAIKVIFQMESW